MGQEYFCFTIFSNNGEAITQGVLALLSVLLIGDAVRKFCRMRGSHNSNVTKVYLLVVAWWGTFMLANAYAILIFLLPKETSQEMSNLTKYSFLLQWLNAYLIQSLLLLLPYQWGKQIVDLFSKAERSSEVAIENEEEYEGLQGKIYVTLKVYMVFRLLFLGMPALALDVSHFGLFFKMMVVMLLLDCVFITLSLLVGMYSLKTTRQLKEHIDEDESKRMFNQYLMIILANTIRFGFDILYLYNSFSNYFFPSECPNSNGDGWVGEIVTNIATMLFSHYLPIFIILRIYSLEDKPEEMCNSLLITTTDS